MLKIFLLSSFLILSDLFAATIRDPINSNRYQALSGQRKVKQVFSTKVESGGALRYYYGKKPSDFLTKNYLFIPPSSRVLDVNMEMGHNAIFLGNKGHRVFGLEDDPQKIEKAKRQSRDFGVQLEFINESLKRYLKRGEQFDAIVAVDVMDRRLLPKLLKLLRPRGVLFVEGAVISESKMREFGGYPSKDRFVPGELLNIFRGNHILAFKEPNYFKNFKSSIIIEKRNR